MGWLGHIPWVSVISAVLTFAVGFFAKQALYTKALDTLGDIADLIVDYKNAQADGKIDPVESQGLIDDIRHIVSDYAVKK